MKYLIYVLLFPTLILLVAIILWGFSAYVLGNTCPLPTFLFGSFSIDSTSGLGFFIGRFMAIFIGVMTIIAAGESTLKFIDKLLKSKKEKP